MREEIDMSEIILREFYEKRGVVKNQKLDDLAEKFLRMLNKKQKRAYAEFELLNECAITEEQLNLVRFVLDYVKKNGE